MLHFNKPAEFAASPEGQDLMGDILSGRDIMLVVVESLGGERIFGVVERVEDGYLYLHNSEDPDDPIGYDISIISRIEEN